MDAFENFNKAPPGKRQAVLNAGFVCFGRDGYQKTAMSEIAKTAGVSKAALFHYFGTKKALYAYLFKFSCAEIAKQIQTGTDDFFESIWLGSEIKMRVMAIYPGMYDFLLSIVKEDNDNLTNELRTYNTEQVSTATATLFGGVNWKKLKPEVDKQMAIELVSYVSSGYIRDHAGKEPPDVIASKLKEYLKLLRKAIYREEYL
ncbi:MAG: TetR/AcrR family transcriptional regulator [Clostridiales bacterium]|jgi:AcrR family transcriptional regulator|nr:TetR/AcrR family transcriptional regulator [Clostridiales bacterium]